MAKINKIIVVGAGPAGLLLSLLLAKKGIKVQLIDAADDINKQPRAAHYGPPAIPDLRRAGILDEIRQKGMSLETTCWRKPDFSFIAGFDGACLKDVDGDMRTISFALQELLMLMLDRFLSDYGGTVAWKHRVTGLGQNESKAWVDVDTPDGNQRLEADYIVGCDGATSQIRRSLFGDEYPGYTWDAQIVATNTYYDFRKYGWQDANFIIDPEHLFMAAIISHDKAKGQDLWRVTYADTPGLSREQILERQPMKFEKILPGHPKPDEYEVISISPYKMHQRLAEKMRVGRFMLAADAAHLCNPFGGLGITGGFVDVGGLYDCLAGIHDGVAEESILDLYSDIRRQKYKEIIDPVSTSNFIRVHATDADTALEKDGFLQICKACEGNDEKSRELLLGSMAVRYDFTQHYRTKDTDAESGSGSGKTETNGLGQSKVAPIAVD